MTEKDKIYEKWYWHSKPVAISLEILEKAGLLEHESGRTDGVSGLCPFYVKLTNGKYITKRRKLHETAKKVRQ